MDAPPALSVSMHEAILHLKQSDPVLANIIERVGDYRIEFREPGFQTLVRSIVYQQLSGKAAYTILKRLLDAVPEGHLTPEAILSLTVDEMRALGLSGQKTAYIRDLAERTRSGELNFSAFPAMADEDVIAHLTRVKGVGVWTAHMFLIFALRRPNVLPTGDLGVRSAIRKAYRLRNLPKPIRIEKIAKRWHPYCSVAAWYLWRSLDGR
jgi:DNA-3-methyladenine glycosylase II